MKTKHYTFFLCLLGILLLANGCGDETGTDTPGNGPISDDPGVQADTESRSVQSECWEKTLKSTPGDHSSQQLTLIGLEIARFCPATREQLIYWLETQQTTKV